MATKRCFVISPIGLPRQRHSREADAVSITSLNRPWTRWTSKQCAHKLADPVHHRAMIAAILDYDLCLPTSAATIPTCFYDSLLRHAADVPPCYSNAQET